MSGRGGDLGQHAHRLGPLARGRLARAKKHRKRGRIGKQPSKAIRACGVEANLGANPREQPPLHQRERARVGGGEFGGHLRRLALDGVIKRAAERCEIRVDCAGLNGRARLADKRRSGELERRRGGSERGRTECGNNKCEGDGGRAECEAHRPSVTPMRVDSRGLQFTWSSTHVAFNSRGLQLIWPTPRRSPCGSSRPTRRTCRLRCSRPCRPCR